MATYKGIQGYSVQKLASDPAATADNEGQMWYNSTDYNFKLVVDDGGYTIKTITIS